MKYKNVKLSGPIAKANWAKEMPIFIDGALNRIGTEVLKEMKEQTKPHDFKSTLTKSLAWRTAKRSSATQKPEYLIEKPGMNEVHIGSAAPHAEFREYGAGVHVTQDRANEFMRNIKEWFDAKIGDHKAEANKAGFWSLVRQIRKGAKAYAGTQGKEPFAAPLQPYLETVAVQTFQDALRAMIRKLGRKYK